MFDFHISPDLELTWNVSPGQHKGIHKAAAREAVELVTCKVTLMSRAHLGQQSISTHHGSAAAQR